MKELLYSILFALGSAFLYRIARRSEEDVFFNRFGSYLMSAALGFGSLLCLVRAIAAFLGG